MITEEVSDGFDDDNNDKDDGNGFEIIDISVDVNRNDFSDNVVMYKLFNGNGEELVKGNLNGKGKIEIGSNIVLEHEAVSEFTMIIWLQETGVNQNEEMKKSLMGTIKVDANQKID